MSGTIFLMKKRGAARDRGTTSRLDFRELGVGGVHGASSSKVARSTSSARSAAKQAIMHE
jgi:hypothetical protein